MGDIAIQVEGVYKQYRLGMVSTGTIAHDLNRWWHRMRGKEDPYLMLSDTNDRTIGGSSEYVWALNDINFDVKKGETLGIIGKNGAGKSTLLKLLSKVTTPTKGSIKINGRIASLLEVGTGFHPELSGRENIYLNGAILGMTKAEIKSKFDEIVDFSGVERYIDTPVKRYSSGMYVRLAFAVAAHLEPEILIIDEVLAVGDAEFQKKCLDKMSGLSTNEGRTILFVSHNISAIRALCKSAIFLDKGLVKASGNVQEAVDLYLKKSDNTQAMNEPGDKIKLKNVWVGNDHKETNTLEYNDSLVLKLTFESDAPILKPYFWAGVKSKYGGLFAANTMIDGNRPDQVNGEFTIMYRFPEIKLLPQEYFISCGARASDGYTMLITSMEIGSFHIVTPVQELGMDGLFAEASAKDSGAPVLKEYEMFVNEKKIATFKPR